MDDIEEESAIGDDAIIDHNRNPTGRNQHCHCPPSSDERTNQLLSDYHKVCTNRETVSKYMWEEHRINISGSTIGRRWKTMGKMAAGATMKKVGEGELSQMVLNAMDRHPSRHAGVGKIKESIAHKTGTHILKLFVRDTMQKVDPEGFAMRDPMGAVLRRSPLTARGPHFEWSGDGHDKLLKYGFPIWGMRDKWSGLWMGLWVMPNNRLKIVIAWLYLSVVVDMGGIPRQSTTDCGSETTLMYGLAKALREAFGVEVGEDEDEQTVLQSPAHRFLRSVHNIKIERGWLDLRNAWGHDFPHYWDAGQDVYQADNLIHQYLIYWLWPKLIQDELDQLRFTMNNHKSRKDNKKLLPSGCSPRHAYALWNTAEFEGAEWCLTPVDIEVVREMMDELTGGVNPLEDWGIPPAFASLAAKTAQDLGLENLTMQNVWYAFQLMLPYMHL